MNVVKRRPEPAPPCELHLPLPAGRYQVQYWDTYEGKVTNSVQLSADRDGLRVDLPKIATDIALRIERVDR